MFRRKPVTYKEDLLLQQYFDLQDWRRAKLKHPIRFWFRAKYVFFRDLLKEIHYFERRYTSGLNILYSKLFCKSSNRNL